MGGRPAGRRQHPTEKRPRRQRRLQGGILERLQEFGDNGISHLAQEIKGLVVGSLSRAGELPDQIGHVLTMLAIDLSSEFASAAAVFRRLSHNLTIGHGLTSSLVFGIRESYLHCACHHGVVRSFHLSLEVTWIHSLKIWYTQPLEQRQGYLRMSYVECHLLRICTYHPIVVQTFLQGRDLDFFHAGYIRQFPGCLYLLGASLA